MALRRPSVYREREFVFQDFLYDEEGGVSYRYVQAKYDGHPFGSLGETFDSSNPVTSGGHVIARLDYTILEKLVVIDHWEVNWRDEWPLRLAAQYLTNCLYPISAGYSVKVNKEVYPFWVSETFFPQTNEPFDLLTAG
jgi:hypothetical protein